jgi:hypothetical protein
VANPTAMAKSDWVTVKYTEASLQIQKGEKAESKNHRRLVFKFDIINYKAINKDERTGLI